MYNTGNNTQDEELHHNAYENTPTECYFITLVISHYVALLPGSFSEGKKLNVDNSNNFLYSYSDNSGEATAFQVCQVLAETPCIEGIVFLNLTIKPSLMEDVGGWKVIKSWLFVFVNYKTFIK